LAAELHGVREALGELSRRLAQIETRVKRVFPAAFRPKEKRARPGANSAERATLSPEQALQLYEELVAGVRRGAIEDVRSRLMSVGVADLVVMGRELGVSLRSSKPTKRTLVKAVLSRMNESVMISRHTRRDELIASEAGAAKDEAEEESRDPSREW
jgi:hypothetical protein